MGSTPDNIFSTFFSHPGGHLSYPEGYPHLQSHSLGLHSQPGSKGATNAFEFNGLNFIAANNSRTKTYAGMAMNHNVFCFFLKKWEEDPPFFIFGGCLLSLILKVKLRIIGIVFDDR